MLLLQGISCIIQGVNMKKKIILILTALLFVCVLFVACDKKDNNNEQAKTVYNFGDPEEVTAGVFTDETTADEICNALSKGNYSIQFLTLFRDQLIESDTTLVVKFAKDFYAEISHTELRKYDGSTFDDWYYQYFVKENGLTYSICYAKGVLHDDTSAKEINPDDCYIRENDLNYVLDLIKNGNYVIENGNVKLIDTEKTKYYTCKDSVRYYNGAVIFNVGTTEAKMIDDLANDDPIFSWRRWLH